MKKSKVTRSLLAAVSVVALSAVMYGCVHNGSSDPAPTEPPAPVDPPEPEPTAYEAGKAAIMAATTAATAQAAYDAVDQTAITGQEDASLRMALADRQAALAKYARIDAQKMALMAAAGMIDTSDLSTQELVDAARAGIVALRAALAAAADVSDADKAMYMSTLDTAVAAVDMAQGGIDTATRRTNQMAALTSASTALQAALAALSGSTPTQAQLDAANAALTGLNTAITGGADLTDAEKATYVREAANAAAPISTAQAAKDKADADKDKADNAAMAALATKLYNGIGATPLTGHTVTIAAGTGALTVDPAGDLASQALTEDKKMMVAANHGWEGKRHTASGTDVAGTYEAMVFSNVGKPTEGEKFSAQYSGNFNATTGILDTATTEGTASRVASPSFDQSAGVKSFTKDSNVLALMISGTYHGVSGTYSCVPGENNKCAAQVAAEGFNLGGVTEANAFAADNAAWTFKPTNPDAKVMSMPDTIYASYGWWLHTAADGDLTASAFAVDRGDVPNATGLDSLNGKATYRGGAAGKYALKSSTGGTNDAGHFTARATLEADFTANMISGTIDNFMGAGGAKNWSVSLGKTALAGEGTFNSGTADPDPTGDDVIWTINGVAGAEAGSWTGRLQDNGADSVPKVGSGTFHTTYGGDGRMVGAFGVNKQQ